MTFDRRAFEARGLLVVPGFIDLHAHLREPGFEESETIATGAHAALRGGFTTVCAMPNTEPAIDTPGLVAQVTARAASAGGARVLPIATITKGRRGAELSDFVELAAAGAVAFSDDGTPVSDARLFRHALEYSRTRDVLIVEHPQDRSLSGRGAMHEGSVSAELGLAGLPAAAEEAAVARDLALARLAGARLHLTHLSTAGSVELVRRAKAEGTAVTCDVTPHHLALTDEWVAGSRTFAWEQPARGRAMPYDANTKVNPPLRSRADVRALWAAIADGTVDAIATDHAPHASIYKDVEFDQAAFGISGLETALSLVLGGVDAGWASWDAVLAALTSGPAAVLGIALPKDDWTVIDPGAEWIVDAGALISKGKNTPLLGMTLKGRIVEVAVDGEAKFDKSHAAEAIGAR
jgi:dihydroorotase